MGQLRTSPCARNGAVGEVDRHLIVRDPLQQKFEISQYDGKQIIEIMGERLTAI